MSKTTETNEERVREIARYAIQAYVDSWSDREKAEDATVARFAAPQDVRVTHSIVTIDTGLMSGPVGTVEPWPEGDA